MSKLQNGQWRIIEELDYKKREGGEEDEKKPGVQLRKSKRYEQDNNSYNTQLDTIVTYLFIAVTHVSSFSVMLIIVVCHS